MNLLPSLSVWPFALAGLIAAAGPVIIHLLNRRRFRVVEWAAMDFLREAIQRNRRIMQLRDILLLLLRTAAVLLFGLALARPFFTGSAEVAFDRTQPLHAVLLVDNSLSMGYESLGGTLLSQAQDRGRDFIEQLPRGSRVTILPLCASASNWSLDPYRSSEAAIEALGRIEVVDRPANLQQALDAAKAACEASPELAKRVVLLGDQQLNNWRGGQPEKWEDPPVQVVAVGDRRATNTWIADFRLQDGIADVESPATFVVQVRHEGEEPRDDVEVTLEVDGMEVGTKSVRLRPQDTQEVTFQYVFDGARPEPGLPEFVPVSVKLPPDRLPADDERHLVVPVVAGLPVVFVDQYGAEGEDPIKNRFGETRHLRRLLVPTLRREAGGESFLAIRHVTIDELDESILADARLVVIAGVADPGEAVPLLRSYVLQGGQLVIAAGGAFDPAAWQAAAWREGAGILPAPLAPDFLGQLPEEAVDELRPFRMAFSSRMLTDGFLYLGGASEEALRDLYSAPLFFRAARPEVGPAVLADLRRSERERLGKELELLAERQDELRQWDSREGELSGEEEAARRRALEELSTIRPNWVLWENSQAEPLPQQAPEDPAERERLLDRLVEQTMPEVLVRFDDPENTPYLLRRGVGRGTVVFAGSGMLSSWNSLPRENTFLLFDRITRALVQSTLPRQVYGSVSEILVPLPTEERNLQVTLRRPGSEVEEVLDAGFIGRDRRGVKIANPAVRGRYDLRARRVATSDDPSVESELWSTTLVVNGEPGESELEPLTREGFAERVGEGALTWVGPEEEISLAGTAIYGQDMWRWLVAAVLLLLLAELLVLAWPHFSGAKEPAAAGASETAGARMAGGTN